MTNDLQRLQYEVEFDHRSLHSSSFHPKKGQIFHMLKRYWLHIWSLVQQTTSCCPTKILNLSSLQCWFYHQYRYLFCLPYVLHPPRYYPITAPSDRLFTAVHHTAAFCLESANFTCLSLLLFSRYIYPFSRPIIKASRVELKLGKDKTKRCRRWYREITISFFRYKPS